MITALIIGTIWLLGAVGFAISDGWFEYKLESGLFWVSIFWFLVLPICIPIMLAEHFHTKLRAAKEKQKIRIATEEKIRVDEQKELEKIEAELETYDVKTAAK